MNVEPPTWYTETLDFEQQQRREVMARFGLAGYHGQRLERQIALMLTMMYDRTFLPADPEGREELFEKAFDKTLGRMVRDLEETVHVPRLLAGRLRHAVNQRNWLAHSYFWERAVDLAHAEGRESMIAELQQLADYFRDVDGELSRVHDAWIADQGVTQEQMDTAMREVGTERGYRSTRDPT